MNRPDTQGNSDSKIVHFLMVFVLNTFEQEFESKDRQGFICFVSSCLSCWDITTSLKQLVLDCDVISLAHCVNGEGNLPSYLPFTHYSVVAIEMSVSSNQHEAEDTHACIAFFVFTIEVDQFSRQ